MGRERRMYMAESAGETVQKDRKIHSILQHNYYKNTIFALKTYGKNKKENGVITAFFSLILLLVIVLIVTLAESAYVRLCYGLSEKILAGSTRSLLAGYSLPLYENYHIFGRTYNGIGNIDIDRENDAITSIKKELSWFLEQNTGGKTWLDVSFEDPSVFSFCTLTERNGEAFYEQAIQYAKYGEIGNLIELLLTSAEQIEQAGQVGLMVQKTAAAAQNAAKAEATLLKLIECIDGFETDDVSFVKNIFGKVKVNNNFAKKLVSGEVSEARLMPGNQELYQAQKKKYFYPSDKVQEVLNYRGWYQSAGNELYWLEREYEKLQLGLGEANKETIEKELLEKISMAQSSRETYRSNFYNSLSSLRSIIQETKSKSQKALLLLEQLLREKEQAKWDLEEYAKELEQDRSKLPEDVYIELKAQNDELLFQISMDNSIGLLKDMKGVQNALQNNIDVFGRAETILDYIGTNTIDTVEEWRLRNLSSVFSQLNLRDLVFSYQDITLSDGSGSFFKTISKFAKNGLIGLVLEDSKDISQGRMSRIDLPSADYKDGKNDKWMNFSFSDLFDGKEDAMHLLEASGMVSFLDNATKEILYQALFLCYLSEHFSDYSTAGLKDNILSDTPADFGSVGGILSWLESLEPGQAEGILYQLEYIIFQQSGDKDNLTSAIARIFFIRYAMNLMMLYCSKECRAQMKQTAAAMVGFTGIGALVVLVELLIGLLWAAECAVVETACLLRGEEVSFFAKQNSRAVDFTEILKFTKGLVNRKVEEVKGQNPGGFLTSYQEYLFLFLALKEKEQKTLAAMDVVQQAIRLKYDDEFRLKHCICNINVRAGLEIPYRFLPITGILNGRGNQYTLNYGASY